MATNDICLPVTLRDEKHQSVDANMHRTTLASLRTETLRHITDLLLFDQTTRLSMVGCPTLACKLSSTSRLHYKPDPWFSHGWPKTLPFPHPHTLIVEFPEMEEVGSCFIPNAFVLPASLTSLSFSSIQGTRLLCHMFKNDPSALPLLTTLNLDSRQDRPRQNNHSPSAEHQTAEQTAAVVSNMLGRRMLVRLCVQEVPLSFKSYSVVKLCLQTSLPHLQFLSIPFKLILLPEISDTSNTTFSALHTLVIKSPLTTVQLFKSLPPGLTHLSSKSKDDPSHTLSITESSLLPRGLKYLQLKVRSLPNDDSGAFYANLPPHLTMLKLSDDAFVGVTPQRFELLPPSIRNSLCDVSIPGINLSHMRVVRHGVLHKMLLTGEICGIGHYTDSSGGSRVVSPWSVIPHEQRDESFPLLHGDVQPEIETLNINLLNNRLNEPSSLYIPPNTRSICILLPSRWNMKAAMQKEKERDFVVAPSWPTSIASLPLAFNIPSSLSLSSLPHLTELSFAVSHMSALTATTLPRSLRILSMDLAQDDPPHVETLLCSLPIHLYRFQLTSTGTRAIYDVGPEVAAKLPRGLLTLKLFACTMSSSCRDQLPKRLVHVSIHTSQPRWWGLINDSVRA